MNAAPGTSKGGGKGGTKGHGGAPKTEPSKPKSKDERGKQPCVYFALIHAPKGTNVLTFTIRTTCMRVLSHKLFRRVFQPALQPCMPEQPQPLQELLRRVR